ncbi:MAG: MOSC domain-containing protein [Saprospiraceae bacterium]
MDNLKLSEIWVYPIKSLGGISLNSTTIERRGLQYDRRWMLVDENGVFLTQRKHHEMALLQVDIKENGLEVRHKINEISPIYIPFEAESLEQMKVQVWDDECEAFTISDDINHWFTSVLGINCRLVYMPENSYRQVDIKYASKGDITSFSDAYPILIIGQASLDKLNDKLVEAVPMNRFRPNLVFKGGQANEEDTWKLFKIGNSLFFGIKPCARCVMTTINQDNGKSGREPLKTLSTYRKKGNKILFGQNVIAQSIGEKIQVGDTIEIVKT